MPTVDKEWDERRLCPDGGCVGVLNDDGLCSVCHKRGGEPVEAGQHPHAHVPAAELSRHDEEVVTVTPSTAIEPEGGDGAFDDERELCSDGACIGVIGANGRCKVCDKPRS